MIRIRSSTLVFSMDIEDMEKRIYGGSRAKDMVLPGRDARDGGWDLSVTTVTVTYRQHPGAEWTPVSVSFHGCELRQDGKPSSKRFNSKPYYITEGYGRPSEHVYTILGWVRPIVEDCQPTADVTVLLHTALPS